MDFDCIMPKPKRVILSGGEAFAWPASIVWSCEFASVGIERRLDEMGARRVSTAAEGRPALAIRKGDAGAPASLRGDLRDEAYHLNVGKDGILIEAATAHGAFNGLSTLLQMLKLAKGAPLPTVDIVDWPDVKLRAFHIALANGDAPSIERFVRFVETLASLKYNALVIEYDNRFPWVSHPKIAHRNAYSLEQLGRLVRVAEENFVETIPLLDSLGHAQPYLVHKEYAHLRELPDQVAELCPQHPGSLALMKELWAEVLALHRNSRYAHITGDEVFRMGGFCPQCAEHAAKGTLAKLFTGYYAALSRWIVAQGKIPMLWDDMLWKYPEDLDNFPRDIVLTAWCYHGLDERRWRFRFGEFNPEGECSPARQALFRKCWATDTPGEWRSYPMFTFFVEQGFTVMGSTAASASGSPCSMARPRERFLNCRTYAEAIAAQGGTGVINTFWSSPGTVEEAWPGVVAGADFPWHSRPETFERFAERLAGGFLAGDGMSAARLLAFDGRLHRRNPGFINGFDELAWRGGTAGDAPIHVVPGAPHASGPRHQQSRDSTSSIGPGGDGRDFTAFLGIAERFMDLDETLWRRSAEMARDAVGEGDDVPIDIAPAANCSVDTCMAAGASRFTFGHGDVVARGVRFVVPDSGRDNAIVTICGTDPRVDCTPRPIPVGGSFDTLFFLTTAHFASAGKPLAAMTVDYDDGSQGKWDVVAGVSTDDWWAKPSILSQGICAWTGMVEDMPIFVYLSWWRNPHPERPIASIRFSPAVKDADKPRLVLLGVTGRKRAGGKPGKGDVAGADGALAVTADTIAAVEREYIDACARIMAADEASGAAKAIFARIRHHRDVLRGG
jgi:hypothetical protein